MLFRSVDDARADLTDRGGRNHASPKNIGLAQGNRVFKQRIDRIGQSHRDHDRAASGQCGSRILRLIRVNERGERRHHDGHIAQPANVEAVAVDGRFLKRRGKLTTVDLARLRRDSADTIARARHIMGLYEAAGVSRSRVLIKIASTWEGIQAARALELEGIHCNLTLLFSFCQAVACGEAGVQLISPFVGRIYDWYKKAAGSAWDEGAQAGVNDPGVKSVSQIYTYYKKHGIRTEVMGASFRNVGQITALAGCDLLTISPDLLAQLQATDAPLTRRLDAEAARAADIPAVQQDEKAFRCALNEDAMATEKLAEGIRLFAIDAGKLDQMIESL